MTMFQTVVQRACVVVAVLIVVILAGPALLGIASHSYFFRSLVSDGGMNSLLAQAIAIFFGAAVFFSVRHAMSLKRERRTLGLGGLACFVVAFHFVVYFASNAANRNEQRQQLAVLEHAGRVVPSKGEPGEQVQEIEEDEQSWRDTYAINLQAHPLANQPNTVLVAIKGEPDHSHGDLARGYLVQLLEKGGKRPVSSAFKRAFFTSGLFDEVWDGDRSLLDRLHATHAGFTDIVLARVNFSAPTATDFTGFVSIQGQLSLLWISEQGTRGPWVYTVSGAGSNPTIATANCVKRLIAIVDGDALVTR